MAISRRFDILVKTVVYKVGFLIDNFQHAEIIFMATQTFNMCLKLGRISRDAMFIITKFSP